MRLGAAVENNHQNSLELDKDLYQINKLICINSMKNICYIELDVTRNTVLYGNNNLGKTSILSTLKLHLLPEVNFRDSKNKFAFIGSSGKAYSNQESRDYYFPSINSYLILEGENPFGPYVYILFRASEEQFGYSRLVLPVSYAEIEDKFWNKNSSSNQQLGEPAELSLKLIKSLVKQYKGRLLRSTQDIRDTIYSFNQLNEEKGRFCIIPMKEGGIGREVEAFRRLLQFTFEINQGSPASLTNALATIIEGQKKSKKDELDQNLQAIIEEYNDLNIEQDKITRLKNTVTYYQRIKQSHSNAVQGLQQSGDYYWQLKHGLLHEQQKIQQQEIKIIPEYEILNTDLLPDQDRKYRRLKEKQSEYKSHYDGINGHLKHEKKQVARIRYLLEEEYSGIDDCKEIEEILRDYIENLNETIKSLYDKESFAHSLQNKIKQKNELAQEIERLEKQLENKESSLLYQVSSHAATVLSNINANFDQLSIEQSGELAPQELLLINEFSQLFVEHKDLQQQPDPARQSAKHQLFFKQQRFIHSITPFDPQQQHDKWLQNKTHKQEEVQKLSRQIDDNSKELNRLSTENLAQKKIQAEQEQLKAKDDLALIINKDKINQDFQGNNQSLQEKADQLIEIQREMDSCYEQLEIYKGQKHQLKQQLDELKNNNIVLNRLSRQIKKYNEYEVQFAPFDAYKQLNSPAEGINDINDESMARLDQQMELLQYALNQTEQTIHDLVLKEKLEFLDTDAVYRLGKPLDAISSLVEQLSSEYENIDSYEKMLHIQVRKHNKIVGTKVSELEQNNQLINDFRRKLDHSFSGISISDLKEIHVKLKLDPRFDELLADIQSENVDFYHDSLISADFYDKLNTFCGQFFTSKNGKAETLTMEGLIKEVLYEYCVQGQEKRTTSSQSNGTNAIINSTFLTILLKELIQPNIILSLPIVFDEIANLDYQNMLSVVNVARDNHFSLFSATPTENLQLNNALGHFIHLDLFKATEKSYDEKRSIIYYGGAESLQIMA